MKSLLKKPRGTQDILPKDSYKWSFVEKILFDIAQKYGFREIRVPTFEYTDLFCRSVGNTSDVVDKEMYTFEDKSSRLITLRPEGTSGVIRSVLEHNLLNEGLPLKLAYMMSCFRYEKPETGRLREFNQFGIELLGASLPQADLEAIIMAVDMLNSLNIVDFSLNINSIGCHKCRKDYKQSLINYMNDKRESLCKTCQDRLIKNPMRILDCKDEQCKYIVNKAPVILDFLCQDCYQHFETLKDYLKEANINYNVNGKIVRGLDYYTKTVFEFIVNINGLNLTVCGGGRYDNLVSDLGGPPTPAFGFGFGMERLIMIINNLINLDIKEKKCDIYVIALGDNARRRSISIIKKLRSQGYVVETDLICRSLKSQMKYANKIGSKYSLVIGDNEILSGKAVLKNMETSEVSDFKLD